MTNPRTSFSCDLPTDLADTVTMAYTVLESMTYGQEKSYELVELRKLLNRVAILDIHVYESFFKSGYVDDLHRLYCSDLQEKGKKSKLDL